MSARLEGKGLKAFCNSSLQVRLLKVKGLSHNKKAIENREQYVETSLKETEGKIVVKLKKSKDKFR